MSPTAADCLRRHVSNGSRRDKRPAGERDVPYAVAAPKLGTNFKVAAHDFVA
jgi:hypothetical protein